MPGNIPYIGPDYQNTNYGVRLKGNDGTPTLLTTFFSVCVADVRKYLIQQSLPPH